MYIYVYKYSCMYTGEECVRMVESRLERNGSRVSRLSVWSIYIYIYTLGKVWTKCWALNCNTLARGPLGGTREVEENGVSARCDGMSVSASVRLSWEHSLDLRDHLNNVNVPRRVYVSFMCIVCQSQPSGGGVDVRGVAKSCVRSPERAECSWEWCLRIATFWN